MNNKQNTHKILLKPTWGRMSFSPGNLLKLSADVTEKALNFYQRGGKLFIIKHAPEQDLLAQMLLGALFAQILSLKKDVKLFLPEAEFSRFSEILSTEFLLVHNLPQFPETLFFLTNNDHRQIIIATGTEAQWEQAKIGVPAFYYHLPSNVKDDWRESFEVDFQNELDTYGKLDQTEKMIFERVIALQSIGIPVPIDLLANSLNLSIKETIDLVTEIEEKGVLECLEDEQEAELLVCSNSAQFARRLFETKFALITEMETFLTTVINSVESEYKAERYTVLNLFQAALSGSPNLAGNKILSRSQMRKLIETCQDKLAEIWSAGDEIEHLLWGKTLEELQRFDLSAKIFDEGLSRNKKNPYLKQAKARMLGKWSLVEQSKEKLADEWFEKLTNETAKNPYFLQARGVFENARNQPRAARKYFQSALNVAEGEENKAYILTAWANLEIEQANFEEAKEKLNQIFKETKSPYVPHLWAKLCFYDGNYREAFEKLKELFSIRPFSIEGWELLGETALRRAHWKQAKTAFNMVLDVDSENPHALRALGDLETDLGKFEGGKNNLNGAQIHFQAARKYFTQALEADPFNFYAQVSTNVLLREEGKLLQLQDAPEEAAPFFETVVKNLRELNEKYPFNEFITHNLGETCLVWNKYEKARSYFAETDTLAGLIGLAKAEAGAGNTLRATEHLGLVEQRLAEGNFKGFERVRVLNSLAEVWLSLEDLDKAASLAQTSFDLDQENGFTLRLYAKICRLSGKEKEADLFEKQAEDLANPKSEDFPAEKK